MIVITGGGTGGHLIIAKAIKDELNKRGIYPVFIGSTYGQDRAWFENDKGFSATYFLDSRGVVNKGFFGKIYQLFRMFKFSLEVKKIFKKHHVKKVFSVGGFSAAPAVFAAIFFKKELFIHEQNAIIGSLNKFAKVFANEFFSSFDKNSVCKEYPVDERFFRQKRVRKKLNTILFVGGSLGAKAINDLAMSLSKELIKMNIKVIHISGNNDYKRVKEFYQKEQLDVKLINFTKDMPKILSSSDFAISRSGASSLFEIASNALPALFIPYPYAAKDHQYLNAKFLSNKGMAFTIREEEIDKKQVLDIITHTDLHLISTKLFAEFKTSSSRCIVDKMIY